MSEVPQDNGADSGGEVSREVQEILEKMNEGAPLRKDYRLNAWYFCGHEKDPVVCEGMQKMRFLQMVATCYGEWINYSITDAGRAAIGR